MNDSTLLSSKKPDVQMRSSKMKCSSVVLQQPPRALGTSPPSPPRTRRRSYISDLGGGDSVGDGVDAPAPAFAPPLAGRVSVFVVTSRDSTLRDRTRDELVRAIGDAASFPGDVDVVLPGDAAAPPFLAGDADGERALESAFLVGLAGISSMITPPVLLVPRGDDPPVRSRTASPWFLDRNATVTTSTSTVRPAYPVRVHANPHPASCARLSLNTSENRCHASLHAASHASITRGPIARTTGAHANAPTQTNATVASGPSHHTLATEETIHAHTHARSVLRGRSHVTKRSIAIQNSAASGARAAALEATHPPSFAATRRAACSRCLRPKDSEAKSDAAPSAAEAPEPSSAPSRNGSGCESAA
jgi:hypothetical protein